MRCTRNKTSRRVAHPGRERRRVSQSQSQSRRQCRMNRRRTKCKNHSPKESNNNNHIAWYGVIYRIERNLLGICMHVPSPRRRTGYTIYTHKRKIVCMCQWHSVYRMTSAAQRHPACLSNDESIRNILAAVSLPLSPFLQLCAANKQTLVRVLHKTNENNVFCYYLLRFADDVVAD